MNSTKVMIQVTESDTDLIGWLSLIGFLTMYWSPIERSIDQSVNLIYSKFDGKAVLGKKPQHLESKLDFIKNGHHKISSLSNNQNYISELILVTKPIAEKRNIFVHGLIEEWSSNQITISKIKRDERQLKEIFSINIQDLEDHVSKLADLAIRWNNIVALLISCPSPSPQQDT